MDVAKAGLWRRRQPGSAQPPRSRRTSFGSAAFTFNRRGVSGGRRELLSPISNTLVARLKAGQRHFGGVVFGQQLAIDRHSVGAKQKSDCVPVILRAQAGRLVGGHYRGGEFINVAYVAKLEMAHLLIGTWVQRQGGGSDQRRR